jgi:hypothetical protein
MKLSRIAFSACTVAVSLGAFAGPASQAAAMDLSFLGKMNPKYRQCVNNLHAQLQPQYRADGKINDAIVTACNSRFPAFGR